MNDAIVDCAAALERLGACELQEYALGVRRHRCCSSPARS